MAQPAFAERKVALVVGNSGYTNVPRLPNPRNDASDMIGRLKAMGFDVIPGLDLDRNGFLNTLATFGRAAEGADVALFFYAGHGLQVNGQNYLLPIDAKVEYEAELDIALIPVPLVMQQLGRGSRVNIVILDACRDNPFA
ncbi:caspase family protein, partial [Bradyrhizobium sp.]|uniref:caspase family protein n=1 Tax=Bradyrhizobium sp. TaxID=376 RepID=UPI002737570D